MLVYRSPRCVHHNTYSNYYKRHNNIIEIELSVFERYLTKYYITIQNITRQKSIKLHEITLLRVFLNII